MLCLIYALAHLLLVRIALSNDHNLSSNINTVAICAGSGASVLENVTADLYLTGEMGHHDMLLANSNGTSVILCEHSNTERGYLTAVLKEKLFVALAEDVRILVSKADRDPVTIV